MPRTATKSLIQASLEAPHLAHYAELIARSKQMLTAIGPLVPPLLRDRIKAGPLEQDRWCIFADNNSVAAKLRQLQPALEAHLRTKGSENISIRIKVLGREPR